MLDQYMLKGAEAACAFFGVKLANIPVAAPAAAAAGGLLGKAKAFGQGQLDAGKAFLGNMRGGLGGAHTPEFGQAQNHIEGPINPGSWHREQAVGNLKTLAPSLLAGGGLYMMHRHKKQQAAQAEQQAMMQQASGYPPM